jgi:hypothetical protein
MTKEAVLRPRDDAGSETVEIVVVLPALLLLVVFAMQVAMWALAAHAVALGAAEGGAEARSALGSRAAAVATVRSDIESIAGPIVGVPDVHVNDLPDDFVEISVTGQVPSVVPGVHLTVFARSAGPVQEFRASG